MHNIDHVNEDTHDIMHNIDTVNMYGIDLHWQYRYYA